MSSRISNEKIDNIRNSNTIEDVISEYINIQKKGKNYVGVCPFHDDTLPSLTISPEKQIFKCFACGAGGNVFSFVQKYKSISFLETVKELAERSNIDVSELRILKKEITYDKKSLRLFELNLEALNFFKYNIQNNNDAINFAKSRKIENNLIEKFDVGYADGKVSLTNFLTNKGFEKSEIISGGLAIQRDDGKVLDIFFNRLMFPIKNEESKIIGFSGRTISDKTLAKYLNTPETHIFKKSELLYNIDRAKNDMKSKNEIFVTEGFMDVIALSTIGIDNSVAIMGTLFSETNIKKLKKITKNIVLSFDNDIAGAKAIYESSIKTIYLGIKTDVLNYDKNFKDLDELIQSKDIEYVQKELSKRLTPIEFRINQLSNNVDLSLVNNKTSFLKDIKNIISLEKNEIAKETYLNKISNILNIDINTIRKEFHFSQPSQETNDYIASHPTVDQGMSDWEKLILIYNNLELSLIKHAILSKTVYKTIAESKYSIWWKKKNKIMWFYLDDYYRTNNIINMNSFLDTIKDEDIKEDFISLIDSNIIDSDKITIYSKEEVLEWIKKLSEQDELKKQIL